MLSCCLCAAGILFHDAVLRFARFCLGLVCLNRSRADGDPSLLPVFMDYCLRRNDI